MHVNICVQTYIILAQITGQGGGRKDGASYGAPPPPLFGGVVSFLGDPCLDKVFFSNSMWIKGELLFAIGPADRWSHTLQKASFGARLIGHNGSLWPCFFPACLKCLLHDKSWIWLQVCQSCCCPWTWFFHMVFSALKSLPQVIRMHLNPVRQLFLLPCLTWKYSSLSNCVDVFFNEILKTPKDVDKRSEFFPPELFCSFSSIAPRCMHSSMPSFCCRGIGDANDKLYLICTMCHRVQKGSMQNGCLLAHLPTTTQRSRTFFRAQLHFIVPQRLPMHQLLLDISPITTFLWWNILPRGWHHCRCIKEVLAME